MKPLITVKHPQKSGRNVVKNKSPYQQNSLLSHLQSGSEIIREDYSKSSFGFKPFKSSIFRIVLQFGAVLSFLLSLPPNDCSPVQPSFFSPVMCFHCSSFRSLWKCTINFPIRETIYRAAFPIYHSLISSLNQAPKKKKKRENHAVLSPK